MVNPSKLNELYNILDLYLVTSRIEGGPQAIMEASITRTPIYQQMLVLHLKFYMKIQSLKLTNSQNQFQMLIMHMKIV